MALRLLQPGTNPLGQFDGYDSQVSTYLGGEVATLVGVLLGTDKAAADVEPVGRTADGYVGTGNKLRPVVTKTLVSGTRPLFLVDEGTSHYGTLFGSVVGGTVGQVVTGGAVLGPHTAIGSGKLTLWDKPGLYAVTLDAVDTTALTGLVPGNGSLTVGAALYATTAGLLTPNTAARFENVTLGRFIEFTTDQTLVTTPNTLVGAVNSGGGPFQVAFTQAVFTWLPPV